MLVAEMRPHQLVSAAQCAGGLFISRRGARCHAPFLTVAEPPANSNPRAAKL
jgi:hypothetical protein